jgi:hypothetical protein
LDHKQKISHLKALYHIACADKQFTKEEAMYIKVVAERMGVDIEELKKFNGSEPALELPGHEYKIQALFHRLAIIIMIDNTANEKEKQYCFNLGIKMGLHPNAISEIITHITTQGVNSASPESIIAIFKKYSN